MTIDDLIAFEREIAEAFNAAQIRAPVHLAGGNERSLIHLFTEINRSTDWVCTTWRSHYHCLLKGVPRERLKADILAGRSITLNYPEHRILSSAIVAGHIPIALGLAMQIARAGGRETVWCFLGDMAATTGIFSEAARYAEGHDLRIRWIVEDNGKSVCTPTLSVWGKDWAAPAHSAGVRYRYHLPWPHAGAGKRVEF